MPQSEEIRGLAASVDALANQVREEKKARDDAERTRVKARRLGLAALVVVLATIGLAIRANYTVSEDARKENCADVREAFDNFTSALVTITEADPETEAEFRSLYEDALSDCH